MNTTLTTPTLSLALACTATVPETLPAAGVTNETVGVSDGIGMKTASRQRLGRIERIGEVVERNAAGDVALPPSGEDDRPQVDERGRQDEVLEVGDAADTVANAVEEDRVGDGIAVLLRAGDRRSTRHPDDRR